jgi:hypothetical protein
MSLRPLLALVAPALLFPAVPVCAQSDAGGSAEARLAELDVRITRLEDGNAIETLQNSYGYFVDKSQWSQLAELFAEDATLEIGGKGIFTGKDRVLAYMQLSFGPDGARPGTLINHMQFQPIADISEDGTHGWIRSRAYVMANESWGLPLYEDEFVKEDGVWKFARLTGPFTMYTNWEGWGELALNNTWPDKFGPPPDLPPSVVYLTYPAYYIVPFHYPHPVTGAVFAPGEGEVGAYFRPPGTREQESSRTVGRTQNGDQAIARPPVE